MLAAAKADGRTVIEMQRVNLRLLMWQHFGIIRVREYVVLVQKITTDGVESLHGTRHQVIPDRIEAVPNAMAAAIGKGIKVKMFFMNTLSFITTLK
ncbi:MAG: hypothetical protein ACLS8J_02430 [Streptococcus salivarius]